MILCKVFKFDVNLNLSYFHHPTSFKEDAWMRQRKVNTLIIVHQSLLSSNCYFIVTN